jgi:YD repeat-containing protein
LFFAINVFLPLDGAYGYNKPWDQGHDATNPGDPDDPEEPPEPPCDECQKVCYLSPVSCSDGNYIYKAQDLFIPGNMPLDIIRIYNSRDNMRSGFFGYGWSSILDMKLVYVTESTGNLIKVLMPNGQRYDFKDNRDGTFTPPLGVYQTLIKNADGSYLLKEKDGSKYEFNPGGKLLKFVDRNSNQISITYDSGCPSSLSDGVGRTINITKGPNGKIASISDFTGRTVTYSYDANGNLTNTTNPNDDATSYQYDSVHNLIRIIDPLGNTIVSLTYYSDGKVSRIVDREGDHTYNYISSTETQKRDNSTGAQPGLLPMTAKVLLLLYGILSAIQERKILMRIII